LELLMKLWTEMEADFLQMALIKFAWRCLFRMPFKNLSLSKKVYICTSVGSSKCNKLYTLECPLQQTQNPVVLDSERL
jgi:hypothetical protein